MKEINFDESLHNKEVIGKELGQIRNWESYYKHKNYSPYGDLLVKMTREHLIETIYHCVNVIKVLETKIKNNESK